MNMYCLKSILFSILVNFAQHSFLLTEVPKEEAEESVAVSQWTTKEIVIVGVSTVSILVILFLLKYSSPRHHDDDIETNGSV